MAWLWAFAARGGGGCSLFLKGWDPFSCMARVSSKLSFMRWIVYGLQGYGHMGYRV